MDECNVAMDDCMAAMVLMSLSCSPKSPIFTPENGFLPSSLPHKFAISSQSPIQSPGPLVETDGVPFFASSSAPTWSHLDMVRPPHEDPEYRKYIVEKVELLQQSHHQQHSPAAKGDTQKCLISNPINIPSTSLTQHYARPLNLSSSKITANNNYNNAKYMRSIGNSKCGTTLLQSPTKLSSVSPTRRTRGETKKCRKMYGMDNRDSWCTQCKWKKACSRFVD
ncbi:zinc finger protein 704-like protein [Dinothrombium tinctorium]|uniref:Zinc finger protein 704-like protein n=1 Tax=Dinothrombium tinctorium TaxID=1965070 RepID=A0A443R9S2_9ACAR|nr:zinc finger protein 704-like protein [Dinothrombium tinctorium]